MKTNKIAGPLIVGLISTREASALPLYPLAQIPPEVRTGFEYGLGLLFMIGFIWGVINIWGGAEKLKRGDAEGKMGVVSGIVIAGASTIMTALFFIFGVGDGALTPQF